MSPYGTSADGEKVANQVIFAKVPETGKIQDVSEGTWVYWIEPEPKEGLEQVIQELSGKEIRAELYRVDDPFTLEGQRYVSDTLPLKIDFELGSIHIDPPKN